MALRILLSIVLGLALAAGSVACGGSGGNGAAELAKQRELQAARAQAAQDARQAARITALERRLERKRARPSGAPPGDTQPPESAAVGSLVGAWAGEAAIEYDSGESDPFEETIEITSLRPGEFAGYGEAHQGNTICHGPLTFEGISEGWYRFGAVERNVAECIDYSEVELMPDGAGAVLYRETTESSVSTGTLERIR